MRYQSTQVIAAAQASGSTATTFAGAYRYLRTHLRVEVMGSRGLQLWAKRRLEILPPGVHRDGAMLTGPCAVRAAVVASIRYDSYAQKAIGAAIRRTVEAVA